MSTNQFILQITIFLYPFFMLRSFLHRLQASIFVSFWWIIYPSYLSSVLSVFFLFSSHILFNTYSLLFYCLISFYLFWLLSSINILNSYFMFCCFHYIVIIFSLAELCNSRFNSFYLTHKMLVSFLVGGTLRPVVIVIISSDVIFKSMQLLSSYFNVYFTLPYLTYLT